MLEKHSVRSVLAFSDPSRSPFGGHLERHGSRGCEPKSKQREEQMAHMGMRGRDMRLTLSRPSSRFFLK